MFVKQTRSYQKFSRYDSDCIRMFNLIKYCNNSEIYEVTKIIELLSVINKIFCVKIRIF